MSTAPETRADAAALQSAFDALSRYTQGAARGALRPLDEAVAAATRDPALHTDLERRFLEVLRSPASSVAKEYVCAQLAVIGGPATTDALGELLAQPELAHTATNALQVMPAAEAAATLRGSLARLDGLSRVGAVTALGMRRDTASAEAVARLLADPDARVVSASLAALGEIGTRTAAEALRRFAPGALPAILPALADACLVAAQRLRAAGDSAEAKSLLDAVLAINPPEPVRAAARRLNL